MLPTDFEGSNTVFSKPANMTDEQCYSVPAYKGVDDAGFPFVLIAVMPNKEDMEALNAGRPLMIKFIGETMPPVAVYTFDENYNPNI